jgi:PAP2 superfamily
VTILDRPTAVRHLRSPLHEATAPPRRAAFLVRQLLLMLVGATVYFGVRSLTAGDGETATANAHDIVALEQSLGIFVEQQAQAHALDVPGAMTVVNSIYIYGHWPAIAAVFIWLAWRRPDAYPIYRNALLLSGLIGMAIVALHPVAPPRLMDLGFVDTVTTQTNAYRVLQPPAFTNPYAAMPSFHVGWDLLVGIALVRESSSRWARAAGRLIPVLMVISVVLTGNHYLLDAVAGDAIVLASLGCAVWWRRSSHQTGRTSSAPPSRDEIELAEGGERNGEADHGDARGRHHRRDARGQAKDGARLSGAHHHTAARQSQ